MPFEGLQLGHYRLLHIIGSGGMGEVYLAEDPRINRQVAIKVIHSEFSGYDDEQDMVHLSEREAKAIAMLDHPHILPLFDYGEQNVDGILLTYLVMPFRSEGSLNTWLQERSSTGMLHPQLVRHFLTQAASALQYAHDHQIVHQDVKPANFLMRHNHEHPDRPDILLADFGIAKLSSTLSNTNQAVRGTPTYMAPEQWRGQAIPATDQYALAIMTYELLTGRPPFHGPTLQVMYLHTHTQPHPPSTLNPALSPAVDAVLLRALEKDPAARFPSISAFALAFRQALQSTDSSTIVRIPTTPAPVSGEAVVITRSNAHSVNARTITPATLVEDDEPDVTSFPTMRQPGPHTQYSTLRMPITSSGHAAAVTRRPFFAIKDVLLILLAIVLLLGSAGLLYAAGTNQTTPPAPTATVGTNGTTPAETNATTTALARASTATSVNATATAQVNATHATATANVSQSNATATVQANIDATAQAQANAQATAQAQATATAQANATATAVAGQNPYPPYQGTLIVNDPLSDNSHGENWKVYSFDYGTSGGSGFCKFVDGTYHASEIDSSHFNPCVAQNTDYSNFTYQVQMTILQGSAGGVYFRGDSANSTFYYYDIGQDGSFKLIAYVKSADGRGWIPTTLTSGTSSAIITGLHQTNLIAVVANGSNLALYVNKQLVTSVTDSNFSHGQIGVISGAASEVAYSNVEVWTF